MIEAAQLATDLGVFKRYSSRILMIMDTVRSKSKTI